MKTNTQRWPLTSDNLPLDFRNQSPLQPLSTKLLWGVLQLGIAIAASAYFILQSQLRSLTPFSLFCSAIGLAAFVCSTSLVAISFRRLKAARQLLPSSAGVLTEHWLDEGDEGVPVDWAQPVRACRECDQRLTIMEFPGVVARIRQQWADRAVEQFNKQMLVALLPPVAGFMAGSGQLAFLEMGSGFGSWLHFYWPLVAGALLSLLVTSLALLVCSGWERAFEDWQQLADECLIQFALNSQTPQPTPTLSTLTPTQTLDSTNPQTPMTTPSAVPVASVETADPSLPRIHKAPEPVQSTQSFAPPSGGPPFIQPALAPWDKKTKVVPEPYIPENTGSVKQES